MCHAAMQEAQEKGGAGYDRDREYQERGSVAVRQGLCMRALDEIQSERARAGGGAVPVPGAAPEIFGAQTLHFFMRDSLSL